MKMLAEPVSEHEVWPCDFDDCDYVGESERRYRYHLATKHRDIEAIYGMFGYFRLKRKFGL
jgi:hypothetical protein